MFVKGNLAALQSACERNGIAIQEGKNKVIEGWEGQKECCKSFGREASLIQQKEKKSLPELV